MSDKSPWRGQGAKRGGELQAVFLHLRKHFLVILNGKHKRSSVDARVAASKAASFSQNGTGDYLLFKFSDFENLFVGHIVSPNGFAKNAM